MVSLWGVCDGEAQSWHKIPFLASNTFSCPLSCIIMMTVMMTILKTLMMMKQIVIY